MTPWTVTCQASLSMGFPRQKYWTGLPCPPPGDLTHPGIDSAAPAAPAWQADSLPLSHLEANHSSRCSLQVIGIGTFIKSGFHDSGRLSGVELCHMRKSHPMLCWQRGRKDWEGSLCVTSVSHCLCVPFSCWSCIVSFAIINFSHDHIFESPQLELG